MRLVSALVIDVTWVCGNCSEGWLGKNCPGWDHSLVIWSDLSSRYLSAGTKTQLVFPMLSFRFRRYG